MHTKNYRTLAPAEIEELTQLGCSSNDWGGIWFCEPFNPQRFRNVTFSGLCHLGSFEQDVEFPGGVSKKSGIYGALLHNCRIGNNAYISNVRNYIANYDISDNVVVENCDLILLDGESSFGNGVLVDVLDETGGRHLMIYDRLSAHTAYVMAFYRHRQHLPESIEEMIRCYAEKARSSRGYIGRNTRISNCNQIVNVKIGEYARITGASRLKEGSINSNQYDPVVIGANVVADHFIVSSGSEVSDSAVLSHCFVGQGCILSKHYSAIHSLFFCNCQGFNGEACSIFAGPFTVTHHKSTLLIAGMFSFLNAGSGSNQSNHMYKLGPIHHGIVERGSKTTSDSYLLWPAKIGPFTLVMGRHYKNSDTSNMPFSYLIEKKDESWLAPAVNLRSVGTIRDAMKWPRRDLRKDPELLDSINFNLLSPYTIQRMISGKKILEDIRSISGESCDKYAWETTFISRSSLQRGIELYNMAILKFLGNSVISRLEKKKPKSVEQLRKALVPENCSGKGDWIDLAGLIAPKSEIEKIVAMLEKGEITSMPHLEQMFKDIHLNYYEFEWNWVAAYLEEYLEKPLAAITVSDLVKLIQTWKDCVTGLDRLLYEDARKEFRLSAMTGFGIDGDSIAKEQDFLKVRGSFEKNRFVTEIIDHIRKKSELGDRMITFLLDLESVEAQKL